MTQYYLVFDGLQTARVKPVDDATEAPLAWFRIEWVRESNSVRAVHIYSHAEAVSDRGCFATRSSIPDALAFCADVTPTTAMGSYDWSQGSVEAPPGSSPS